MNLLVMLMLAGEPEVARLSWMTGCWEVRSASRVITEQWTTAEGGTMMGVSKTVRNGKTVFDEFLKLSREDGKLVYRARIGTPGVTPFSLLTMTDSEVIFENKAHDFPKRIIYRKQPNGLMARIEGDGKHQDFPYVRVSCTP